MNLHALPILAKIDDFLFFIVIAVFGLIRFISSQMKKTDADETPDVSPEEQARRTRQIQEEIRRRLVERMEQEPASQPMQRQNPAPQANPYVKQTPVYQIHTAPSQVASNEAVRRADIMTRLAEAKVQEEESRVRALQLLAKYSKARETAAAAPHPRRSVSNAAGVIFTLRGNPAAMREAVIMSEIIGGPISERHGNSCPGFEQS
ncbi:MAG: hypothetical protein WC360_09475 [Opitutales bacterium]|jgi:thiol:disulfide interchange protein